MKGKIILPVRLHKAKAIADVKPIPGRETKHGCYKILLTVLIICTGCLLNAQAPGGVTASPLQLWLKAGTGVSTTGVQVSKWNNQATGITMATQPAKTASSNVVLVDNGFNYNPVLRFKGAANQCLTGKYGTVPATPNTQCVLFTVSKSNAIGGSVYISELGTGSPAPAGPGIGNYLTSPMVYQTDAAGELSNVNSTPAPDQVIIKAIYPTANLLVNTTIAANGGANAVASNPTVVVTNLSTTESMQIGGRTIDNYPNRIFNGDIAEVIHYNGYTMSAANQKKIESYLAIKYGITLDRAGSSDTYVNSAGNSIYNDGGVAAFWNDIIGIGRDDNSALYQKQSHTIDDSLRVFVNSSHIIPASNVANTNTIGTDKSSIVIGNNKGRLRGSTTLSKPASLYSRLARVWKITNTNFTDNFNLEIKWDSAGVFRIADLRLLVSDDPNDFTHAAVYDSYSVNFYIGSIIVTGINSSVIIPVNSTKYITIGSVNLLTPLTVQLQQFSASVTSAQQVKLDWTSAKEINSNYFVAERSAGGSNWEAIATVYASGNSTIAQQYTTLDKNPYVGISYYRLKQVDRDGKFEYSETRSVTIHAKENGLIVYPNPAGSRLVIKGSAAALKTFKLFTMSGQDVSSLVKTISNNFTTMVLDLAGLSAGMYTIKTNGTVTKLLKQ